MNGYTEKMRMCRRSYGKEKKNHDCTEGIKHLIICSFIHTCFCTHSGSTKSSICPFS